MGQPSSGVVASGIGVLDKSIQLLDAVAVGPCSLNELVETTSLPRATAHRLAVALECHRLLARGPDGRFVLGPRLGEFAGAAPDALLVAAAPVLLRVRDDSDESTQLYRRDGSQRICVAAAERAYGLRTAVAVGTRLPMTAGSGAQVLTAWTDPVALPAGAEFTQRGLAEVRRRGWAQSIAQREAGVASVSAPVFDAACRVLAAVSVSGPIERLGRSPGRRLGPLLVAAAADITSSLR